MAFQDLSSAPVPAIEEGQRSRRGPTADTVFIRLTWGAATLTALVLIGILLSLLHGSLPAWRAFGTGFLVNENWNPAKDVYGAAAPIFGTLVTSAIAMVIGVPVSLGIAMFLTEMCPDRLRIPIGIAIELLAGIPSIIYGLWGFFVFTPFLQTIVQPVLINYLGPLPVIGPLFDGAPYGIGLLTAGLVLSVMILPFMTSVSRDIFLTVPPMLRESAYGMGMTTWEVTRSIVLPYTRRALVGGLMLGLGRALGETMAVTFVIGNAHRISASLLSPSTTISASIANEFSEATTPLYTSSLVALGLVLFAITFAVFAAAKILISRSAQH